MRIHALACIAAAVGVVGLGSSLTPAHAQSLACGGEYTVVRGDTLQKISRRAFGQDASFNALYKANRSVVGPNPSLIEVGMVLTIPCVGGAPERQAEAPAAEAETAETETAAVAAAPASLPAAGGLAASQSGVLRMMTGSDWAPFSNQNQEQGGMITEIVNVASQLVMEESEYKIDFINDWSAHMTPLIEDGAYDFTFPWFRPNCDVKEKLGAGSQFRCERLAWSDPLFEQIIGYYMRASDAEKPQEHSGLFGKTVCRPAGYSTFMMEEKDLVEPNVTMATPNGPADCFEMLVAGEVDAVVIATMVGDDAIAQLDDPALVEEQPQLSTIATLHAVTSIDNPDKEAQLAILNEGIAKVRENGKWFEIVQRHLVAHARKTASN